MSHAPTYHIKTRWQTKSTKSTNICTWPPNKTMNEEQQANVKQIFSDLLTQLHLDMEKESEHQRNQLHQLQTCLSSHMEKNKHKPRYDLQLSISASHTINRGYQFGAKRRYQIPKAFRSS